LGKLPWKQVNLKEKKKKKDLKNTLHWEQRKRALSQTREGTVSDLAVGQKMQKCLYKLASIEQRGS